MPVQSTSVADSAASRPAEARLYKVAEVIGILGLSRTVVFDLLRSGRLRSVREGQARRVPAAAIAEYLELLDRESRQEAASR
jgi:excisionase family DNA binding protein